MNKTIKKTIDGQEMIVDSTLEDYTIYKCTSSFIDYIAVNGNDLFIQFNKGNCVLFSDVPIDVIKASVQAPSIGKFYHVYLKDKYESMPVGQGEKCIKPAPIESVPPDEDFNFEDNFTEGNIIDEDDDEY